MNLRDIGYFAVLAAHRHVGRAAEELDISQPALSLSLRRLEKAMTAKLVKRTPKGVELTATGAALLSRVSRLRLVHDDVAREVSDLAEGRSGSLRVGAHPGMVRDPLAGATASLLKEAPGLLLTVNVMDADRLLPVLQAGEADLILHEIPLAPPSGIEQVYLFDDEVVIFSASTHPLARRKRVALADLAQERWALTESRGETWLQLERLLSDQGLPAPRVAVMTASLPLRDHLVAGSLLLGISSRRVLAQAAPRSGLAELRIPEARRARRVGASFRGDGYLSPAAGRFIKILRATSKQPAL